MNIHPFPRKGSILLCVGISLLHNRFSAHSHAATATVNPGQSIQAAMDSVANAGGGIVYLNSGNYSVWMPQNVPDNVHLKGNGTTRPVVTLTRGSNVQVITNKSVPFSNVNVDFVSVNGGLTNADMDAGTWNNTLGIDLSDHFHIVTNTNGTIINCYATNCSMGYNMGRILSGSAQLNSCNVTNCGGAPIGSTPGLHNIYISTCNPFTATYVTSTYCRTGIGLKVCDFEGTNNLANNLVDHCTCSNNQGAPGTHNGIGIGVWNLVNPIVRYCTANNNNGNGVFIQDNNGAHTAQILNSTFTGNYSQANVSYDIYLINVTSPVVSGCTYSTHKRILISLILTTMKMFLMGFSLGALATMASPCSSWSQTDISAIPQAAKSSGSPNQQREDPLLSKVSGMTREFERLRALPDDIETFHKSAELENDFMAMLEGCNVASLIVRMPGTFLESHFGGLALHKWATTDRAVAAAWMASHLSEAATTAQSLAGGWFTEDPQGLKNYLAGLPDGSWKNHVTLVAAEDALTSQNPRDSIQTPGADTKVGCTP